ncbi:hypothetical protein SBX64_16075 [Vibrio rhizosphaerae]|uniref:Uncharacterized protein n=1 Tax=Vibrio rhizosphaerae TaxID=398736 RepID=A0ABU4IXD1_9VIBR|nr:hypothetical protein [Vibrio rhizosphaerae]MDW6094057.1 hypothetical protein [Vibrio rhizosphaerae]
MKADLADFFCYQSERDNLEPVTILPSGIYPNQNNTTITLDGWKIHDFEYFEFALGIQEYDTSYSPSIVGIDELMVNRAGTNWSNSNSAWEAYFYKDSDESISFATNTINAPNSYCYIKYVTGYRRRLSRTGLGELLSAMSLPNLCANSDLRINQRDFDGNWSKLAVGGYGYDQWMKVSDTHMAYVIEDGYYKPNSKYTVTRNNVVLGSFVSPLRGHFAVSLPFSTDGRFDIYMGEFKRPWHPIADGLERCRRYFYMIRGTVWALPWNRSAGKWVHAGVYFATQMRVVPKITCRKLNNWAANYPNSGGSVDEAWFNGNSIDESGCWVDYPSFDASIPLSELNNQIFSFK